MSKAPGVLGEIGKSVNEYAAARESAQTIVASQVKNLNRELTAWRYLETVMQVNPPTSDEEAALWDLVCRARRERY